MLCSQFGDLIARIGVRVLLRFEQWNIASYANNITTTPTHWDGENMTGNAL